MFLTLQCPNKMNMSNEKKKIYKPRPISGFPEWLPQVRRVEQQWFDHIRRVFESYGYCNIETPSVEELDAINAKGGDGGADADKEIYVIERLHKEEGDKEARLALHFDQTVPLARYTAQHFNELDFPFKRYQMQRVWRGERPQAGRFREFYQCDIDVINVDHLPLHFDAEMPAIIWEILSSLPGMENEKIQIRVSNRKILMGLLEHIGIKDLTTATRIIDKFDKIGKERVFSELTKIGLGGDDCDKIFEIIQKRNLTGIICYNSTMEAGLNQLDILRNKIPKEVPYIIDLSIVRGLDYYTGTVYETNFLNNDGTYDTSYGSICSGGRYDDLAGNYISKNLPGVGISLGFSRLFEKLRNEGKLPIKSSSPAHFFVFSQEEKFTTDAPIIETEGYKVASYLRKLGYNVDMYPVAKGKKQLAYADKKGIPYVWLVPYGDMLDHQIKQMSTGKTFTARTCEELLQSIPNDWKIS